MTTCNSLVGLYEVMSVMSIEHTLSKCTASHLLPATPVPLYLTRDLGQRSVVPPFGYVQDRGLGKERNKLGTGSFLRNKVCIHGWAQSSAVENCLKRQVSLAVSFPSDAVGFC